MQFYQHVDILYFRLVRGYYDESDKYSAKEETTSPRKLKTALGVVHLFSFPKVRR